MKQGLEIKQKDLLTAPNVVCERCHKAIAIPIYELKLISPLLNPTGQEIIVPMQIGWKCAACKKVWKRMQVKRERRKE